MTTQLESVDTMTIVDETTEKTIEITTSTKECDLHFEVFPVSQGEDTIKLTLPYEDVIQLLNWLKEMYER